VKRRGPEEERNVDGTLFVFALGTERLKSIQRSTYLIDKYFLGATFPFLLTKITVESLQDLILKNSRAFPLLKDYLATWRLEIVNLIFNLRVLQNLEAYECSEISGLKHFF